ncbi:hypothetical protein OHS58_16535 [Amycolatopsis sp. NBC_00348]|uniref:hypothetical protein n=1 Tax=Amycolatopsis sp. NBC_00348 TaxID=2975956 RepID=UPI002E25BD52
MTAGTLRLLAPHEDQDEVERTVFDPTGVVPGIELPDDRGPRSGRSDGQPAAARPPSMVTMVPLM